MTYKYALKDKKTKKWLMLYKPGERMNPAWGKLTKNTDFKYIFHNKKMLYKYLNSYYGEDIIHENVLNCDWEINKIKLIVSKCKEIDINEIKQLAIEKSFLKKKYCTNKMIRIDENDKAYIRKDENYFDKIILDFYYEDPNISLDYPHCLIYTPILEDESNNIGSYNSTEKAKHKKEDLYAPSYMGIKRQRYKIRHPIYSSDIFFFFKYKEDTTKMVLSYNNDMKYFELDKINKLLKQDKDELPFHIPNTERLSSEADDIMKSFDNLMAVK